MKPVFIIAVFSIIAILISSGTLIVLPSASGLSVVSDTGGNIQGQYIVKSGDNVHIAWGHDTGNPDTVYYAYSSNAGISFSSPIMVNQSYQSHLYDMKVSGSDVYLLYQYAPGANGPFYCYLAKTSDNGATFSKTNLGQGAGCSMDVDGSKIIAAWHPISGGGGVKISTDAGSSWSSLSASYSIYPQVTISGSNVIIQTQTIDSSCQRCDRMHTQFSSNDGASFSSKSSLPTPFGHPFNRSWSGPLFIDNKIIVLWLDDPRNSSIGYQIYSSTSSDFGSSWSTPVNISNNLHGSTNWRVYEDSGIIYVVWQTDWKNYPGSEAKEIYFSKSSDQGATYTTPINLSNTDVADSRNAWVAAEGDDVFVTWLEGAAIGIWPSSFTPVMMTKSDDGGATFEGLMQVGKAQNGWMTLQIIAGEVYSTWVDGQLFFEKINFVPIVLSNASSHQSVSVSSVISSIVATGVTVAEVVFPDGKSSTSNDITVTLDDATVGFPKGVTVVGSSQTIGFFESVKTPDASVIDGTVDINWEFGSASSSVTFDKPVEISFTGDAGQKPFYIDSSQNTVLINQCAGTPSTSTEASADSTIAGGANECYFDSSSNLNIWTKHFTAFGSFFSDNSNPPSAPTSGSISGTPTANSLAIQWTAPAGVVTGYKIESASQISVGNFNAFTVQTANTGTTATTKTITGLNTGDFFKFRISAINDNGTGNPSAEFTAGTVRPANQDFRSEAQTFEQGHQFGAGTKFAANQEFTGTQTFGANQEFDAGTQFAAGQSFTGAQDFDASSMKFKSGTTFNTAQTFGPAAAFTGAQTFVGANTFDTSTSFGAGQTFPAVQTFGAKTEFTGNTDFTTGQAFPSEVNFAIGQQFPSGENYTFTESSMGFAPGTEFGKARTFGPAAAFTGAQTFVGANTFGMATAFGDTQTFPDGVAQTFEKHMHFGKTTDFGDTIQTFSIGTSFDTGTTFPSNQPMPLNAILPTGMVLSSFTCPDTSCTASADQILSPGEFLPPGTDPASISNPISSTDKTFSIPGLGMSMTFDTVSAGGTVAVDLLDPATVTDAVSDSSGKLSMTGSNGNVLNAIGSIMDISVDADSGAATSGSMSITLPYDEANLNGISESSLSVLHYVNGAWITEDNCTTNTDDNTITCSVTSLSPFGIGTSTSSGGGGGGNNNCDSNAFGNNSSLRVYQVMYDIDSYEVQVQAYSTCGSISAKMTTPMQQSILGLSTEQTLLDDRITIYSGYLDESDEKFTISVQNKRDSFDETFYINDKSIIKKYTGSTGYTSEQQDDFSSTTSSTQTTTLPESPVDAVSSTNVESIFIENSNQIVAEKSVIDQTQSIQYTPEPIAEETTEPTCGIGTESVNGICKIIIPDEPQFCFLFWCW